MLDTSRRKYFGTKIGLYFAWIGFYTHALWPVALIGVVCVIYGAASLPFDEPSKEICDPGTNVTLCPVCNTCKFTRLSDSCTYSKVADLWFVRSNLRS